jgi:tagatose 1,6-diphosphate aldolase
MAKSGTGKQVSPKDHFLHLTPGKLAGLRGVTDATGKFKVLALDQSNSFRKFIKTAMERQGKKGEATYDQVVHAKLEITEALAPYASAVLLDVNYGARQAVNSFAVPRGVGLIVRVEASRDAGLPGEFEPGWSVAKIKRMGAAAVKLLVYMDVEDAKATKAQMAFVKRVTEDCQKEDILLMIEELSYPRNGEDKKSPAYVTRRPENIMRSAELIGPYADILKLEFPADIRNDSTDKIEKNLAELNSAAIRPWVLLSAGEKFDLFARQVEFAMKAGCSGTMAGRAIFQEYFDVNTPAEQRQFLETTGIERMKKLNEIVDRCALPWFKRYQLTPNDLFAAVDPHWYFNGKIPKVGAKKAVVKGEY